MEKFYFKRYGIEVGSAGNPDELIVELERLSDADPFCVEYHLKNGHIVDWLMYIGETESAKSLKHVVNPKEAVKKLKSVTRGSGAKKNMGIPEKKETASGRTESRSTAKAKKL